MKRGKCEICHALADLRDRHYLPKSGYREDACKRPEESEFLVDAILPTGVLSQSKSTLIQ
jgi:hypothetical protein